MADHHQRGLLCCHSNYLVRIFRDARHHSGPIRAVHMVFHDHRGVSLFDAEDPASSGDKCDICGFCRTPYSRETVPGIILFYFQHLSLDWPFAGTLWFCAAFFACIGMYLDRFGEHFVGIFHKMDYSSKYESANRRSKTADELRNLMRAAINFQARLLR